MKRLLQKLLLTSLVIILLPMGLAMLWTSNTLSVLLERRFVENSKAQSEQIRLLLNGKRETATGLVHWIAEMPGVRNHLLRENRDELFQYLLPLVGSVEMDFIEILDRGGKIFLRVHDPSRYGDRPELAPDVRDLLLGIREMANYAIEERDDKVYLRAAETIEEGGIIGVVSAGYTLNRDFFQKLEEVAGSKVTVAVGNYLFSTAGRQQLRKTPDPETAATGQSQAAQFHRQGPSPALEVRLPLETDRGAEGLISLFFPLAELTGAISALQKTLFSVALLGAALAFTISWILSRRLTGPVNELVKATEQVAAGNLAGEVRSESRDEIGSLAASFNRMLQELRRSKAEVEGYRAELERKFAERGEELAETEKKRATLAHMIAHDLKNPLIGIKKTLERLEQNPAEIHGAEGRPVLQDLLGASDLVIGMVNEMLDFYRSDFGELPLSFSSFSLTEIIQTSLRILGPELNEKGIEVASDLEPTQISIIGDKRRLTRLLTNLLSNAMRFSPDRGRIRIGASLLSADGGLGVEVLLKVEDQGPGIPNDELPRIFDRFYSRDQGLTGTGLGLPYCKLVAEAHRGKIWAESASPGGLAVAVILPVNGAEEQKANGT